MKALGVLLSVFGGLIVLSGVNLVRLGKFDLSTTEGIQQLVGAAVFGILLVALGLWLAARKRPLSSSGEAAAGLGPPQPSLQADHKRADALKFSASLGIGFGVPLMLLGSAVTQGTEGGLLVGSLIFVGGFAWVIWGCVNYMRWKGYSGWLGFLGYLLLPGLLILVCLPNRRKRMSQKQASLPTGGIEQLLKEDRRSGYRFLLTLVPLGLLCTTLGGFLVWRHSSIDAVEWQPVVHPEIGFQALMPGTPQLERQIKETPAGAIELHKFTVKPKGKNELFMIVSIGFPEDVGRELGGPDGLLELGRQDLLSASQGRLISERQIVLSGSRGLELEVLPPKGAIIKARIYATQNQLFQVYVYGSKMRLKSHDVEKLFDSFKLSGKLGAGPDFGGR